MSRCGGVVLSVAESSGSGVIGRSNMLVSRASRSVSFFSQFCCSSSAVVIVCMILCLSSLSGCSRGRCWVLSSWLLAVADWCSLCRAAVAISGFGVLHLSHCVASCGMQCGIGSLLLFRSLHCGLWQCHT